MKSNLAFSKRKGCFIFLFTVMGIFTVSFPDASGIAPVMPGFLTLNAGGVQGAGIATFPVTISVTDVAATGAGTIQVNLTSSVDSVGFNLTLNEGPPGTFTNTNLALMSENGLVTTSSTLQVTIFDDSVEDPLLIQTLPPPSVRIVSDSDTAGISPTFTETGINTNLFSATINFGTSSNSSTNTLAANPGDIFTIIDGGNFSHGFVIPNPNVGKGAIMAEVGGTITATYQGDSSSSIIVPNAGPGRGSGGLIKPGLVIDSPSSGVGGCDGDCDPPTLGVDRNYNRIVQNGFSFNNNPVDVKRFYTPYPLITTQVGQKNIVVLKIFDDGGIENIEHVSLAYGLGKDQSFNEGLATINWDKTFGGGEHTSTLDPENTLDNVKVITSQDNCNNHSGTKCLIVTISHIFREELEFNMVGTNVWDFKKNAWQNFYNHGIEVKGDSLNPPRTKMIAFGEKNMRGLYELTELDKKKHLWIDEFGNHYLNKGNDHFERIFFVQDKIEYDKIKAHGCDRDCNWFNFYKLHQVFLAENTLKKILDGKVIQGEKMEEPFSYSYHFVSRADNLELQKSITQEQIKAEKILEKLLNP